MRYSIITPTILRPSLLIACESVNTQTSKDWEHIVMVDCEISNDILAKISHPQRTIFRCERPHRNWGHSCRNRAWSLAKGDYVYCLDDDNFLMHDGVLKYLEKVTAPWAIFPIKRLGERFFNDPPGLMKTDTGSMLLRRDVGPWPDLPNYETDGIFVEQLLKQYPYQVVGDDVTYPLMVMPTNSLTSPKEDGNRVSIFTPAHSNTFLREAYESIKDQDFYEWIIVYNNGGVPMDFGDPRVKAHVLYQAPDKVGTLKAYACSLATGDILLELDCDDMLLPGAIEETKRAFADPDVCFAYSNAVHAMADLTKFPRYDESFGWKYREIEVQGKKLDEFVSFAPSPESVSRVWFGPDHFRAFRRSVYEKVGGHNKAMRVLDDSELVIRMYLAGKFKHIDKGLYLYRVHGQNSWLKYNQEIQENVWPLYEQNIQQIVRKWAEERELDVVDVQRWRDIKGRPDNSAAAIFAMNDVFSKFHDPLETMKEVYRVLIPGGWLFCQVPSTDGRGAWQDPTHQTFWNENSFLYYTHKDWAKYIDTPVRFQAVRLYTTAKNQQEVCWTVAHLVSLKDGYRPAGELQI